MRTTNQVELTLELNDEQAEALAQLCKRFGHDQAESLSTRFDGNRERDVMITAIHRLRRSLWDAGYAPR